jgi:hypothetical protein
MVIRHTDVVLYAGMDRDVVVLPWPLLEAERVRLDHAGVPHLLLVEAGIAPPIAESCLEDWLRLPADDVDVRARVVSLSRRAAHHPIVPVVDEHGQLTHRGLAVFLSPLEHRLVVPLIENFGHGVADEELVDGAWPEGGGEQVLRVHVSRLRRRIAPLGLSVVSIRGFGYLLREHALERVE